MATTTAVLIDTGERKGRADAIRKRLRRAIPEPVLELRHENPWQLLMATILAAQSTDKKINEVTPKLFGRFPDPAALAAAPREEVEQLVHATGFFRAKADRIQRASQMLVTDYGGRVPPRMDALVRLPGVARKTANVVLGIGFRKAGGIAVDTHVSRLSQRLGLTVETEPVPIEQDLCALIPKRSWIDTNHRLVLHGRYVCQAKKPDCGRCPLFELCPSADGPQPRSRWGARADAQATRMPPAP
ncbi:MAG: endonuclease III [Myxococcota bacterium]